MRIPSIRPRCRSTRCVPSIAPSLRLHGRHGEDGTIQGVLELMQIPFTGSGVMRPRRWAWTSGVPSCSGRRPGCRCRPMRCSPPTAISPRSRRRWACRSSSKPACEGSSIGISKVKRRGDLAAAYAEAAKYDPLVLAEQGILGGEYTVGIIEQAGALRALPIIKIEPATEFYDYEAKYNRDDTQYRCPCRPAGRTRGPDPEAGAGSLPCSRRPRLGRVDFLMDEAGNAYFLEANTSPGMTDHSLVPMAARVAGIDYDHLVLQVLAGATLG